MASRSPYTLGGRFFKSKDDVRKHVQGVLSTTQTGNIVSDLPVLDLFTLHPEWCRLSIDMKHLSVGAAVYHGIPSRCFVTIHGEEARPISYKKPLDLLTPQGKPRRTAGRSHHLQLIVKAARSAVVDQIIAMGAPAGCEVDHTPPATFAVLLREFVRQEGRCLWTYKIASGNNWEEVEKRFEDQGVRDRWIEYHRKNAMLRVLTREEHKKVYVPCVDWSDAWTSDVF